MENKNMISVGLLLVLFNGCWSQDGDPLNPFDVPAIKVLFRCDGRHCKVGQDCINVDGTPRCADPCKHYSVLNDTWRANDHHEDLSDPHCDDDKDGWYRMYLGDVSVRMPERCQPLTMCGTLAPLFLVQPHPKVGDGVQEHTVCGTWENGCCKFNLNPIHVKACPGNYVVYKLVNQQDCRVGYCAEVNTKVCASCAENEDCVSDDKITYSCEKRESTPTPEAADDGSPINPFDVPAQKALFRCNGRVCPPDQDCLTVGGTTRCADPCLHHSVLNDTWRANDQLENLSDPHCDNDKDGWYRMFLGDVSVRMPERCQPLRMCGTLASTFLVQPHPKVGDGVQKHTNCGTWENGCCKFHLNPIHVKTCPGNYVVYKLVNQQDCRVGYCADVNTKVCATCGDGFDCVSDDKINYRCEQRDIQEEIITGEDKDKGPLSPFEVPAFKVLFRCDGRHCKVGQDCINVDGTPRCADPCKHYSVLNDTWRANDHHEDISDPHCDDDKDGWYRMYLGDVSVRMPERCQPLTMCGTLAPLFLVQPHPKVGDGVQEHTVCGTWENGCCKFNLNPIHVKACPGNYVVYKLVNQQDCRVGYCAEVNTKVCASCAENEDCVSDDKITYSCEKRESTPTPEAADDGSPINPFDVPAQKALFRCNGRVCPPDQDCLTVGGTTRCADPCLHHSVLNDTWRANDQLENLSDPHCDNDKDGWYRMFLGDVSVRMPERCQPLRMCGTLASTFLVQPHPKVGDGVQKHTNCGTWENGCCKFHLNPIHVKTCPGNYVVYKLVNQQDCRVGYCADVNTKVCATCGDGFDCVSDDKINYRCEQRDIQEEIITGEDKDKGPLSPFEVPAFKVLFRCDGRHCKVGQDCINVDGTPRCADPCKHYSVLNDTWRANDHHEDLSDPHCDDDKDGWYRMYLGDVSVRMPERCQPLTMCGTLAPLFLVQPHPKVGDGVQEHTVCGTWENGCCKFNLNPIHVKACPGNYVVYKLVNQQDCRVGYCAEVNTKVCASCAENEDCVSDDKITYSCEKRESTPTPEAADDGSPINPFDVPAQKALFRCNGRVCPPDQDCLTVGGTTRCADPCLHHSVLNDTWRANDQLENLSDPHCDNDKDGWYRMFLGDVSVRMPERCQPLRMCGTLASTFLVQPHPKVGDGVQKHTNCGTWENGCCKFHLNPIHVKTCPGNYVVYKLVNQQDCRVGYCADVNTKVCATCGDGFDCVSDDKINYRCEQRDIQEEIITGEDKDKGPLSPFEVPAFKVLFRCDGRHCKVGQDCINVDGTPRCADPCKHYSVLNDTWRANDHHEDLSDPHCDDDKDGWYRMYLGDVSVRMPERCQPLTMCGTLAPLFLVQPHPKVGDGVQEHTVCGTWENGCCKFNLNPIHVKACPGNYVVYKLVNQQDCRVGYCAEVNTKVCASCAENEDCVSDDKITYSCEKRESTPTPEAADDGSPINPFDVPAQKALFRCNGRVCPPDQDCLTVGGTTRCADPCLHHSVLNDTWRANDQLENLSDPHCDNDKDGWYRMFLGDVSVRMPERCQPLRMCGTLASTFLVQPHPKVGDGVQKHTNCGTWENGCCKFHLNPIHVKTCPGNYVVYKLVNQQDCRVGYCADVNTKVCATCGDGFDCVSDDKINYRCEQRDIQEEIITGEDKDKGPLSPFEVPAFKVLFRCDGRHCKVGQDCINVDGTPRCADPCKHYSVLNDTWRANDHHEDLSDPHCDDDKDGWYRMYLGDVSVRMPERCQPLTMCGTLAPLFLVQPHPKVGDGVQEHTVCGTWENGCCKFNLNPIHVKACPGNYVVYKLVNQQDCRVGYCAEVNTKVCASCAENEDCVSDDKITYSCEKRESTPTPEAADDGSPINPFDVPAQKALFRCNGRVCPPDQDCLTVGGTTRCADPCLHHSVLNDTWRANDQLENLSDPHCDNDKDGWYRMFLGDVSVRMPERCQPLRMCGTLASTFLVQPHPKVGDGVQKHTNCGTWENGCCKFHLNPIHVKTCPGNYVVYKLVNQQDCRVGYCADVNTKVCATCGDGFDCVSDDKINYRCEQRDIQDISVFMTPEHAQEEIVIVEELESFRIPNTRFTGQAAQDPLLAFGFSITIPKLVCGPKFMDFGVKLEEVDKAELDINTARMSDPRCVKGVVVNGRKWFRVPRTEGACGNTVLANSTHAIYSNHLFLDGVESKKTQVLPVNFPFTCFYPRETEANLHVAAISAPALAHKHRRAVAPPVAMGMTSGVGPEPKFTMSMYKTSAYKEIYPPGPRMFPLGEIVYLSVTAEDVKEKDIVVVLEDCYQTHSPDFNDPNRDPLIIHGCSADFILVAVLETAKSHQARFSTILVPFPGKDHQMYIHCSARLCDTRTTKCKPTCAGRRFGRSAQPHHHHKHVTIGLISVEKN